MVSKEEGFFTLLRRKENLKELDELIEQWAVRHTPGKIVQLLHEAGVSPSVVQNGEDLAKDPQLMAREFRLPKLYWRMSLEACYLSW